MGLKWFMDHNIICILYVLRVLVLFLPWELQKDNGQVE